MVIGTLSLFDKVSIKKLIEVANSKIDTVFTSHIAVRKVLSSLRP
jgi:hypothetical protein